MRLKIENVARVKKAELELDGITVIAGENGSGKSTVSKCLYSVLNSYYNTGDKIIDRKKKQAEQLCRTMIIEIQEYFLKNETKNGNEPFNIRSRSTAYAQKLSEKIIEAYQSNLSFEPNEESLEKIISNCFPSFSPAMADEAIQRIIRDIVDVLNYSDEKYVPDFVENEFFHEFHGQINNLSTAKKACVSFDADGKELFAEFLNNTLSDCSSKLSSMFDPIYIDSPFILEYIDKLNFDFGHAGKLAELFLDEKFEASQKNVAISEIIQSVLDGSFEYDELGELRITIGNQKLELENLATGLKTFAIIKKLFEGGKIKSNTFLIIDEPEVHLHPEWQLKFAEILVLFYQTFSINMLINTHSPYFLRAIQVYAAKYSVASKAKYYMFVYEDGSFGVEDVTGNTGVVFEKLTKPFDDLENMLEV